ncbi:MAG: FAD-binding oxidoreductase [Pseudomonadota bacterium]
MSVYEDIAAIVGKEKISESNLDRICYSHDLAPLPDDLLKGFGVAKPDVVVRPANLSHIADIMKYASQKNIPVTPRGGGSWGLGGVLPIGGGIVLDLSGMNRIIEVNTEDEYVTVETGVEWKRLTNTIKKHGFYVGACPTSAPVATIGGYIATGGSSGIGVSQHGPLGDQIISLKAVLPDGTVIQTNPWDSWIFVGSEGTLGIVCEATIKIFKKNKMKHMLFSFDSFDAGLEAVIKLNEISPYYYNIMDEGFVRLLREKGSLLPESKMILAVTLNEINGKLQEKEKAINSICRGTRLSDEMAEEEWENRYKTALSIKSLGPTLLTQEIRLPVRFLGQALSEWKTVLKGKRFAFKGVCSDNGAISVFPVVLTDEREKYEFMKTLSYTREIAEIGKKYHGSVYGIGLFNSNQMADIHGKSLDVMKEIKRILDQKNILNPGKTVESRIPDIFLSLVFTLMKHATPLFAFLAKSANRLPDSFINNSLKLLKGRK